MKNNEEQERLDREAFWEHMAAINKLPMRQGNFTAESIFKSGLKHARAEAKQELLKLRGKK